LARKAYGDHATQINLSNYPDDGTSPVGSAEWNASLDNEGMLGFTPQTANSSTIIIASGVATITDSVSVIAGESAATDTLQKLALANTSQYDLVYLFAASSGYVVTLEHGDLNADGEISTVSGANEALSTTVPTILIRKGNYWYGYGGGGGGTPTDITVADTTDTTCFPALFESVTGDLAPKTDAGLTYNAGNATLTATTFVGALTGNASGTAATVTTAAQPAITSTGTLTGLTMSGAIAMGGADITNGGVIFLTEQADAETDVAGKGQLWVDTQTPNKLFFTDDAGTDFDLTAGGGDTIVHEFTNTTTTGYLGTASSFGTVGAGVRDIYIKKIDSNNEGVFTKVWKNGSAVEVQIA